MQDEFDLWNITKKKINTKKDVPAIFPRVGEVWVSSFGKNIGYEQDGNGPGFSRPILVVKKFNNQIFWCIPLSTRQKNIDFYFNYKDPSGEAVSVILAQLKLLSIKRFQRKLYQIDTKIFIEIKEKLRNFIL